MRSRFFCCLLAVFIVYVGVVFSPLFASVSYVKRARKVLSPRKFILSQEQAVKNNRYASTQAQLRSGNDAHAGEREFLEKRAQKVRASLENLLGMKIDGAKVPRIAVVCSGGGCRAMLGTIGALSGLQDIGVLDATTYITALSGSTWAVGLWMATGMSIVQLKKYVSQRLTHNFYYMSGSEASLMGHMLAVKIGCEQPCTAVDLFGAFLANNFLHRFGNNRQMVHLSDQVERIKEAAVPFPIYTAVDGRIKKIGNAPWYEFTPFEIGSADYATYVPSWAYGRYFNNGTSTDYAPQQSLGFHLGVFGSAFAAHAGHIWKRSEHKITHQTIKSFLNSAFEKKMVANARVFWAKVPNFMFGLSDNEVSNNKYLKLVDAGLECNLPYLPVSGERGHRKQDIVIFFDFSKSGAATALRTVEEQARARGLKFPVIDYAEIEKRTLSIFKDEHDSSVPVVMYMPRISDHVLWQEKKKELPYKKYSRINNFDFEKCTQSGFCNTTNFTYTLRQSRQVMDQMKFNVVVNKEKIIDAIRWVVER